jgi:SAM-dependent methyltransferase
VASNKDSMNKTYQDLFDVRGSSYDGAMQRYPQAREQEFAQVVSAVPLQPGMVVADVPAGGGYLRAYLPAGCQWLGHEPCAGFTQHGAASGQGKPWLPLPWCDAAVDVVISLAGVHHVDDKRPLWAELWRVVKPGGHLVLSDVAAGTPVARFLDGYVVRTTARAMKGVTWTSRRCGSWPMPAGCSSAMACSAFTGCLRSARPWRRFVMACLICGARQRHTRRPPLRHSWG